LNPTAQLANVPAAVGPGNKALAQVHCSCSSMPIKHRTIQKISFELDRSSVPSRCASHASCETENPRMHAPWSRVHLILNSFVGGERDTDGEDPSRVCKRSAPCRLPSGVARHVL